MVRRRGRALSKEERRGKIERKKERAHTRQELALELRTLKLGDRILLEGCSTSLFEYWPDHTVSEDVTQTSFYPTVRLLPKVNQL
jgi:hypothetical protein